MAYEQYNQMASNFGSSFQPEDGELSVEEAEVTTRSLTEIREGDDLIPVKNEEDLIKDQKYIQTELKVDIELLGDVTETLRGDLKQGSKPSQFDSFTSLMKERREHLKAYKELNMDIAKLEHDIGNNDGDETSTGPNITNNTVVFTGNEAFDMILAARDGLDPNKEVK